MRCSVREFIEVQRSTWQTCKARQDKVRWVSLLTTGEYIQWYFGKLLSVRMFWFETLSLEICTPIQISQRFIDT